MPAGEEGRGPFTDRGLLADSLQVAVPSEIENGRRLRNSRPLQIERKESPFDHLHTQTVLAETPSIFDFLGGFTVREGTPAFLARRTGVARDRLFKLRRLDR